MKIVYTYYPVLNKQITESEIYSLTLSVLWIKKFYKNVFLYTDKKTKKLINELKIPFDVIDTDILNEVNTKTFSIPKLLVYSNQNEPFLHLDNDLILYKKFNFDNDNKIIFSFNEGLSEINSYTKYHNQFFKTYVNSLDKIFNNLDDNFLKHISLSEVGNMSVFGGINYKIIQTASDYCLDIYKKNKEFFDEDYYRACIIEQLFIPAAIKMFLNSKDYILDQTPFKFLYNKTKVVRNDNNSGYPILLDQSSGINKIESDNDLFNSVFNTFDGLLHLGGYKNDIRIIFLIKQQIRMMFENGHKIINLIEKKYENQEIKNLEELFFKHINIKIQKKNILI